LRWPKSCRPISCLSQIAASTNRGPSMLCRVCVMFDGKRWPFSGSWRRTPPPRLVIKAYMNDLLCERWRVWLEGQAHAELARWLCSSGSLSSTVRSQRWAQHQYTPTLFCCGFISSLLDLSRAVTIARAKCGTHGQERSRSGRGRLLMIIALAGAAKAGRT
jgi:hypothetical protein